MTRRIRICVLAIGLMMLSGTSLADQESVALGRGVFEQHCQVCHGPKGQGGDQDWREPLEGSNLLYPPPPLDHSAHAWHHPDDVLKKIIAQGGGDGRMPPFNEKLTSKEIRAVIRYLHTLWKPKQLEWQQKVGKRQTSD